MEGSAGQQVQAVVHDRDICCKPSADPGALAAVSPIITWLLVILGWRVVHKSAAKRASRQEDLAMIGSIGERTTALRDRAIAYYTGAADRSAAEASCLKHEVQAIVAAISNMRTRKPKHYNLISEVVNFRKAVTGGSFESATRLPVDHADPVVLGLWVAASTLTECLQGEFEKANPD